MPEPLAHALLLVAALFSSAVGFAWLALAMESHWAQVRGSAPSSAGQARVLRVLGAAALAVSLALCLAADHPSMAALVWVMSLAAGALLVSLALAWRPRWLGLLAGRKNPSASASRV